MEFIQLKYLKLQILKNYKVMNDRKIIFLVVFYIFHEMSAEVGRIFRKIIHEIFLSHLFIYLFL